MNEFPGGLHLVHGPAKTGKTSLLRDTIRQAQKDDHANWVATPKPREWFPGMTPEWLECTDDVTPVDGILRHLEELLDHHAEVKTDRLTRPVVLVIDDGEPDKLFTGRNLDILSRTARFGRTLGVAAWIAMKRLPDELPRQLLDLATSVTALHPTGGQRV